MPQRIEFEGQIHEFPDDFTDADIARALSSVMPQVTAPAAQADAPPPYIGASVGTEFETPRSGSYDAPIEPTPEPRYGEVAWQGAGAGLAELAGAPVDLTTAAINIPIAGAEKVTNWFTDEPVQFPRLPPQIGGSEFIKDISEKATGIEGIPYDEMTFGEKMAYNVNRLGSSAIVGGGTLARTAQSARRGTHMYELSRPYREAAKRSTTMQGPVRAEVEAAKPLVTDALSGAGAGSMLTGSQEVFPDSPTADLVATLLGGYGGATAATMGRLPATTTRGLYERRFRDPNIAADPNTGKAVTRRTANQAARFAQQQASDPAAAAESIGRHAAEARYFDEPVPTSGIVSDDIGTIAGERGARLRNPKPFQERDQALKDAAEERVTGLRDPNAEPRAAQRFVEQERDTRMSTAERNVMRAEERKGVAEEAEQTLGGQVQGRRGGEVSASERVAGAVDEAKSTDTARKSGLYREAEAKAKSVKVDAEDLADDARAIRDEIGPLAEQDQSLNNVLSDLDRLAPVPTKDVPEPEIVDLTAADLIAMRPRLSRARDAASRLKRGDVVERLDSINAGIKSRLDDLAEQGDDAALKWQEAEKNFKEDFAPKYREGVGAKLDKAERAKTPVPPSQVGGRFLHGGKEAAEDLNRILKGAKSEAAGQAAARDYVLSDMAVVVDKNGRINAHALRTWIANREGMFRAMPHLREEANQLLRDAVNRREATTRLAKELKGAADNLKRTERDIQQSATALLLDSDPAVAAKRVFSQRDPETAMKEIVSRLKGDKEAAAGWKRAVSEHLIERVTNTNTAVSVGSDGPVSIAKLKQFFDANSKALAAVYLPQEMQALRRAHKILEPLGNLQRQVTSGSPTIENKMLWHSVEAGLLAVTGNAITTGMIMKRIRTVLKFLPDQAEQVERLTTRMYFEPELAQHLLTRNVKEVGSTQWNAKLMGYLGAGEAAREINELDKEK